MASALADGESVQVKGSSSTYTLSRKGGTYMCSCPAWKNQGAPIDRRTCKHLRAYLGDAAETERAGKPGQARGEAAASTSTGSAPGKRSGRSGRSAPAVVKSTAPPILLAHKWELDHDPTGWWMSE